jgi:hypothetical protein
MRLAFLAKYREFGLLLIRVSIGLLFILYTARARTTSVCIRIFKFGDSSERSWAVSAAS